MNKSLIAVLLLGLVVVAMAAEVKDRAKSEKMDSKMEKLRERKAKLMAKKQKTQEKLNLDKIKKGIRDMPFGRKPDLLAEKHAFKAKYDAMKEEVKSGLMSKDEFKRIMRKESKRGRAEDKKATKSGAIRSKRSTKEAFRKVSKNTEKMNMMNLKKRRSPTA